VLLGAVPGLFVGTTTYGAWLDRVVVHDLGVRSAGWLSLATNGVHIEREGVGELFVPFDLVHDAELGDALAGKVIGKDGLLLLHWRLGPRLVTSGFRADDHAQHRHIAAAVRAHLHVKEPS
ncbi:MAG: transporter, partial [Actinomycetota bacterium]|nr:transporter [Actinomycetota bacterium]